MILAHPKELLPFREIDSKAMVNSKNVQGVALPVPQKKKKGEIKAQSMMEETAVPMIKKKQPPQPKAEMVRSQGKGKSKIPVSRSARAGLQFPVGR